MNAFDDGCLCFGITVMAGKSRVVPEKFRVADTMLFAVGKVLISDALEHGRFNQNMLFECAENTKHTDRFVASGEEGVDFFLRNRSTGLFYEVLKGRFLCCTQQVAMQFCFGDGSEKLHMFGGHRPGKR